MKLISRLWLIAALILSHAMCAVVAYDIRDMICGISHMGYSAPWYLGLLGILPFGLGIAVCLALSYFFGKKAKAAAGNAGPSV